MSAGGDLDGDQFTVIWDPDFVPAKVAESYTYPPGKERLVSNVTREDLARHFASYNSMALARIVNLHSKWVRYGPKGAMSDECQDLNALHSLVVDGGSVQIPERLLNPPTDPAVPFILDQLQEAAKTFHDEFLQTATAEDQVGNDADAEDVLVGLLTSEKLAVSEYELAMVAVRFAEKHHLDIRRHLGHVDFSAFSTAEKYALSLQLGLTAERDPYVWNSLMRSEILQPRDLEDRKLGGPLRLQKLYSSTEQGRAAFFEYLREATQNFERRLLVIKTDDRFSVGVFLRGPIAWNSDAEVDQNVVVCSFMPKASELMSTYWQGTPGYRLYCGDNVMQLFDKQRQNSFVFMIRPPAASGTDIVTSIALNKISHRVQQQCGRVRRSPVVNMEIHVVSCRDRIAHQAFDLRFEYVRTEESLKRFDYTKQPFTHASIATYDWGEDAVGSVIFNQHTVLDRARQILTTLEDERLHTYFDIAVKHRVESHVFAIFSILLDRPDPDLGGLQICMEAYPSLVYCMLKRFIPEEPVPLPEQVSHLAPAVVLGVIRSANEMGIAALAALERLAPTIDQLDLKIYMDILWSASLCIRSSKLVQEVLLVLHDSRLESRKWSPAMDHAHKHALGIVFDRAEEAADTCPCDDSGKPRRQTTAPARAKLVPPKATEGDDAAQNPDTATTVVVAHTRVDLPAPIRIHDHVRLQVASIAPSSTLPPVVVDAIVLRSGRGELHLGVKQPLPPEWREVDWNIFNAGGTATSAAMLAAVLKLAQKGYECCRVNHIISGLDPVASGAISEESELASGGLGVENSVQADTAVEDVDATLNDSQRMAVRLAVASRLCLIWGPPGTGKTTVVVQILVQYLRRFPEAKILMTASTHNAVDNVLERFVAYNTAHPLLNEDQIIRSATESSKVNKNLQKFTIDSRLGGSITDNPRLVQKAVKRVKEARIVFTTCAGAGLGVLRNIDFNTVLIDEASQITEPCALIPLVKGCERAVLVGDHVQLRPTVKPMGKALELDKSLFERLWKGDEYPGMVKTMLEVQYRFSAAVAHFPSQEFYEGRLQTGTPREAEIAATLGISSFPWPHADENGGRITPVVFVPCTSEEDYGRSSKSNAGQVALVKHIVSLLRTPLERGGDNDNDHRARLQGLTIAVLTPYSRQVQLLRQTLPGALDVVVSTIDGFQGREGDVVVFSTVRCNADGEIGFVEDERRLNVAWTRPRLGLVIVGDRRTLEANSALWRRALAACAEVVIARPEEGV